MSIAGYILNALFAYLLGSVPTGFLVGKAQGVDIRTVGSGNIGATNVLRTLGKPVGIFVLLADAAKGWLAVAILSRLFWGWFFSAGDLQAQDVLGICAGVGAFLGHTYTCWLQFKGGKGIATSAGVFAALAPWAILIALGIWAVVFVSSRYVSLASICAALALPFAVWLMGGSLLLILVTAGLTVLALYKHKGNIERLLQGTENRFGGKKPAA